MVQESIKKCHVHQPEYVTKVDMEHENFSRDEIEIEKSEVIDKNIHEDNVSNYSLIFSHKLVIKSLL